MFRGLYAERLEKKARRGDTGFPCATIVFYGPDDTRASKLVVSIVPSEEADEQLIKQSKWFSDTADLRFDGGLARTVLAMIEEHDCRSVVMPQRILGCPHEEGKDYPKGEACPQCPFWEGRDRFAGTALEQPRKSKAELLARMAMEQHKK